jgi:6-phosphogluconolactonase
MSTELYRPTITEFDDENQLYTYAESFVLDELLESIGEDGSFRMALSGGSTPIPLFEKLAQNQALPWEQVELYQVDERFTSPDTPESNQFTIKKAFGDEVLDRLKEHYFIPTETTINYGLNNYQEVIDSLEDPLFDLVVLGIGKDGHIASLFPNGDYLSHQDSYVIRTEAGDKYQTNHRISLTLESILNSKKILVLLKGEDKSEVLTELVGGKKSAQEYPAKFLLAHPNLYIFSQIPKDT